MCHRKKQYASREAADRWAAYYQDAYPGSEPQRPYECVSCGGWHLTSEPEPVEAVAGDGWLLRSEDR